MLPHREKNAITKDIIITTTVRNQKDSPAQKPDQNKAQAYAVNAANGKPTLTATDLQSGFVIGSPLG